MSLSSLKSIAALLLLVIAATAVPAAGSAASRRTVKTVKREQSAAKRDLKDASRRLDKTRQQTRQGMQKLNELDDRLKAKAREIDTERSALSRLDDSLRTVSTTMEELESNLAKLKADYARALRRSQGYHSATGAIAFVFSSGSFKEAAARIRYLREFGQWRKRKIDEITRATSDVEKQRQLLSALRGERNRSLTDLSTAEMQLKLLREETDQQVAGLKKESSRLESTVAQNRQKLKKLDGELDRLIVAQQQEEQRRKEQKRKEQEKAAAKKQKSQAGKKQSKRGTASSTEQKPRSKVAPAPAVERQPASAAFESRKGSLPYPVSGSHTIVQGFGRQKQQGLNVYTDNPGIDIAVSNGASAKCIFDGTVSGVFSQDGYGKVVMVRHGNYISIYANLSSISVKSGDKVKAGQTLGKIGRNSNFGNRYVLHFELRNERTRLNPTQWLR